MANEIDLSKILVKDQATAVIKANLDGTEKEFTIRALADGDKRNFFNIAQSTLDTFRFKKIYICLLSCGLGFDPDIAEIIFDHNTEEAIRVGDEIFKLSEMETKAKAKEAAEAEKN